MIKSKYSLLPLSEIATIYSGNSINKKVKQEKYTGLSQGRCFIATKDVDFDGTVCYENGVKIPYEEPSFKIAPPDCVFVCSEGGSAGKKTAYITQEVCFGNKLYAIIGKDDSFVGKYVYYYTRYRGFASQFKSLLNGIIGGVSLKKFGSILIPYPERSVQEQIVQHIEEQLSELDSAVETLKKTKQQLEVYRQAVLKKAFDSVKIKTKVSSFCDVVRGGSPRPAGDKKYYDGSIPFLKVADLTKNKGLFVKKYSYTIKEAGLKKTRMVPANTLLLTNSGATLGVPKICTFETTFNDGIAAFLFNNTNNEYLPYHYYFWESKTIELRAINQGAAQPNLNTSIIGDYAFPHCDYHTQKTIAKKIEKQITICNNIEETVNQSLQQAEALRQSILKQAFEGN